MVVSIGDTGTGMDEETLARAFEPFFTTKGLGIGSGLGLPMVQGFAARSGGAVQIQSKLKGTTVELTYSKMPKHHGWIDNATVALDTRHHDAECPPVA